MTTLPAGSLVEPLDFTETGRGLGCTRDVEEGEDLVVIPLDACWWEGGSREASEIKPLVEAGVLLTALDATALHLLLERSKGRSSVRWAHIEELPKAYDATLFWSGAELMELRGSPWHAFAQRFTEKAWSDWEKLQEALGAATESAPFLQHHAIGWDEYLWAYATLKSRQAESFVDGAKVRLMTHPAQDTVEGVLSDPLSRPQYLHVSY